MIQHSSTSALSQTITLNQAGSITTVNIDGSENKKRVLQAHGIIMLFIWIVFVSTGITIARYFKSSWSKHKICGKAIWFAIHRAVMIFSAVMTVFAFVLILIYKEGQWTPQSLSTEFAHSIVGIIVVIAAIIQPIMTLFRCQPNDKYRFIFNYAHFFVGISTWVLSIAALFLTTYFSSLNSGLYSYRAVLIIWLVWEFIKIIMLECLEIFHRKHWPPFRNLQIDVHFQTNAMNYGDEPTLNNSQFSPENTFKEGIKIRLLVIHIIVVFILSIALAAGVGQVI